MAPILELAVRDEELTADNLFVKLTPPSLVRLAAVHDLLHDEGRQSLIEILRIAGRFNRHLSSETFRDEAKSAPDAEHGSETFQQTVADSEALQGHLNTIFFAPDSPFSALSQKYLVF